MDRHNLDSSTVGRIAHLAMMALFAVCVLRLSLIWSLGQTIDFTSYIFYGDRSWGWTTGLVVQFGPQAFLMLANLSGRNRNKRLMFFALFWVFSIFDAGTNIGARMNNIAVASIVDRNPLADYLGYLLDVVIVFGEEMIFYALGIVFYDLKLLIEHFGYEAPSWFDLRISDATEMLSGGDMRGNNSGRRNRKRNNSNRHRSNPPATEAPPFSSVGEERTRRFYEE